MTHDAHNNDHRTRLLKSVTAAVLTAAILIASVGFALVLLFSGSLPYFTLYWLSTLPPAKAAHILSMAKILARDFALLVGPFTAVMLVLVVWWQRSKSRRPAQSL